jgi:hypothetical protein
MQYREWSAQEFVLSVIEPYHEGDLKKRKSTKTVVCADLCSPMLSLACPCLLSLLSPPRMFATMPSRVLWSCPPVERLQT